MGTSTTTEPTLWRALLALVWLNMRRQARSRQMVGIAFALFLLAVIWVGILTLKDSWGIRNWRSPPREGPTLQQWIGGNYLAIAGLEHGGANQGLTSALFGGISAVVGESGFLVFSRILIFGIFLSFLLPAWSLSFATEALGSDRENNSLVWLLSRPMPRSAIYLAKFVALLPWSFGFNLGGFAVLCLVGGKPGLLALQLFWPAVAWATLAFAALFYFIGACFRRAAVLAILYAFFLETILGNMPGYLKRVSISFYTRCIMYEAASFQGLQPERPSVFLPVDGFTAEFVLCLATVLLLTVGTILFARMEFHESA